MTYQVGDKFIVLHDFTYVIHTITLYIQKDNVFEITSIHNNKYYFYCNNNNRLPNLKDMFLTSFDWSMSAEQDMFSGVILGYLQPLIEPINPNNRYLDLLEE